jgi:hypothetical protein
MDKARVGYLGDGRAHGDDEHMGWMIQKARRLVS